MTCDATCQTPTVGTCTGTTAGACTNLDLGTQSCGAGVCHVTVPRCVNGALNTCTPDWTAQRPEICGNGVDDDCDGLVDEAGCQ